VGYSRFNSSVYNDRAGDRAARGVAIIESRGPTHGDKKLYLSALTESLLD
jgi:hypothetical protein